MKTPLGIMVLLAAAAIFASCSTTQQTSYKSNANVTQARDSYEAYVLTYYPIAVEQMHRHGIPASITLAQGLLESGAGKSELTRKSNNHFGIKAHNNWTGKTTSTMDNGKLCQFRVYNSARDSYEDHSQFLLKPRYAALFKLDATDYKGWARGLKKAGYAEDPAYPQKLISLIERYRLYEYRRCCTVIVPIADIRAVALYTHPRGCITSWQTPAIHSNRLPRKQVFRVVSL